MLSIRTFARSAPRAASRLAYSSLRQSVARPSTFSYRSAALAANNGSLRTSTASFATTATRRAAESETDEELSAKLESEIQVEAEIKSDEQQPASVKDFLANSPFELIDTPGQEIVKLVRNFGDEKITVSFSIADITNYNPFNEDPALEDEESFEDDLVQSNDKQSQGSARSNTPAPEEEEDIDEDIDEEETAAPINLSITVEKPGKSQGALSIDATAQDGQVLVENIFFYEDAAIARLDKPEDAQKRADVYPGPPFGTLDEDLQVLMERFLEERGITQTLAVFVPDYVDVKEQREYTRWLSNVKGFIDA